MKIKEELMRNFFYEILNFLKNYIILIVSLIIFLFVLEYYFPGFSSPDCLRQTVQATLNRYILDHPPITAYIMHLIMSLFDTQYIYVFFILEMVVYFFGLFLIAKKQKTIFFGLFVIAICSLNPLIFRFLGFIEKDILMIASYLLFFGIVLNIEGYKSFKDKMLICCAVLFLFIGTASRHNAFPVAFFLSMMLIYKIQYTSILKLILKSIIVWMLLLLFINFFNVKLLTAEPGRSIDAQIMFADICAINYVNKTFDFPDKINFSKKYFFDNYTFHPANEGAPLLIGKATAPSKETAKIIRKHWLKMVLNNWGDYIYIKSVFWGRMLFDYGEWTGSIRDKVKNKLGNIVFVFVFIGISPFIHLVILLLIFFYKLFKVKIVYNNKDDFIYFLFTVSGIFYCLPYFFLCCAYDYRYSLWYLIVAYISLFAWISIDLLKVKVKKTPKIYFKYLHIIYS